MANHKKNGTCYEYQCLSYLVDELWFYGIWQKEKLFLWNQSINIRYLNEQNVFIVPNHKRNGDYDENPYLSFSWKNFDSKDNGKKESISFETKALVSCILIRRTCLWWPITKKWKIIMSIHVCFIWWMNFDSKENGVKKSFSWEIKASMLCIPTWITCLWWLITKRIDIIMTA